MAWYQSEEEQRRNTLEVQAERLCVEKKEMEEGKLNHRIHDDKNRIFGFHLFLGREDAINN